MSRFSWLLWLVVLVLPVGVSAQSSAFTYQGSLFDQGQPSNGSLDFRFRLWDAESGGTQVAAPVEIPAVAVNNGRLSVLLDFGLTAFNGADRWLEIIILDPAGDIVLSPRQAITATPYAFRAVTQDAQSSPVLLSGLPSTSSVLIALSGLPAGTAITLAAPLEFSQTFNPATGQYGSSAQAEALTLRRMVGADSSWRDAAANSQGGLGVEMSLLLPEGSVQWQIGGALATGWGLAVADDGLPVEQLTLAFNAANFSRTVVGNLTPAPPPGLGLARGFESGFDPGDEYRVVIDGLNVADYRIASDLLESGTATTDLVVRQNPTANETLVDWFVSRRVRSFELQLQSAAPGSITLTAGSSAGAIRYRLRLADDGLPIEEVEILYRP